MLLEIKNHYLIAITSKPKATMPFISKTQIRCIYKSLVCLRLAIRPLRSDATHVFPNAGQPVDALLIHNTVDRLLDEVFTDMPDEIEPESHPRGLPVPKGQCSSNDDGRYLCNKCLLAPSTGGVCGSNDPECQRYNDDDAGYVSPVSASSSSHEVTVLDDPITPIQGPTINEDEASIIDLTQDESDDETDLLGDDETVTLHDSDLEEEEITSTKRRRLN